MGLTFKKRDDFDKMMDNLGVSTVDLLITDDEKLKEEKKEDPFAKFLAKTPDKTQNNSETTQKNNETPN